MARITLEVQARGVALEANFRGQASYVRRAVQALNRRRGPAHYERVAEATPVRSGFLRDQLRLELTPNDFAYRVGWSAADFTAAGKYPYYRVVLFGSRTQPGNDFFSPIAEEERRAYRRELRELLRGGPMGRAGQGGTR